MGPIKLDKRIMDTMKSWGGNYNSTEGCEHDSSEDKVSPEIENKNVTLNIMSKMDAPHPKPKSDNPGFDKGFWAKADPLQDTTGHGKLTRKLKD